MSRMTAMQPLGMTAKDVVGFTRIVHECQAPFAPGGQDDNEEARAFIAGDADERHLL